MKKKLVYFCLVVWLLFVTACHNGMVMGFEGKDTNTGLMVWDLSHIAHCNPFPWVRGVCQSMSAYISDLDHPGLMLTLSLQL